MPRRPDPVVAAHQEWLGFVRPTGLVVSAAALAREGAVLQRTDSEGQRRLLDCSGFSADAKQPVVADFREFAEKVFGWRFGPRGYAGMEGTPIPPQLEARLAESGETVRPDFAVRTGPAPPPVAASGADGLRAAESAAPYGEWQLLVRVIPPTQDFDAAAGSVSAHSSMERLLRRTGVPAGLLFNGRALRLVSAPPGENSGWLDFRFADMLETAGRPMVAAMRLLLRERRLLGGEPSKRLAGLLAASRKYQNDVSERLSRQVLHALYELLRGLQSADDRSSRLLLAETLGRAPDEVYRALLTVVLRMVFLLYAEERDMLPTGDGIFLRGYSLSGLYDRLREDAALHPDAMDLRYGAWAQLLALSRIVHDGAMLGEARLPPRRGALFDPDRFPFLEGRSAVGGRQTHERIEPPLVPDSAIHRALEKLLVLDGERISYRALDVEHIGSVYETMMGFRLEIAEGRSLAIRAAKKHGAAATVNLDALLAEPPAVRARRVTEQTDRKLKPADAVALREADSVEAVHDALKSVADRDATPDLAPPGSMILQPSPERRRSGSHYTPRELTGPIVRDTLAPILDRLRGESGGPPPPDRILDLKVCDPAMGSGAFLVEACRQLGDALVESWRAHGAMPDLPADENEKVLAMRAVARRCLYGVDRNPVAVDLAKLSLWLATLARDHPLTFLDHALRHGDSLVGLTHRQVVETFHWEGGKKHFQLGLEMEGLRRRLSEYRDLRALIRESDEEVTDADLRGLWQDARSESEQVRLLGDLLAAAYFEGGTRAERERLRRQFAEDVRREGVEQFRGEIEERREEDPPLAPLHWEIELPEVFQRKNPGFDAIVGNPPFAGKNLTAAANREGYPHWLREIHPRSHGNADLVVHFFRRSFGLLREGGAFGLIATNTIAQGDTRATGLRWICSNGGEIYRARRRVKWPGASAAVVVSVVHVARGPFAGEKRLDGEAVDGITAFLFHRGGHDDPARLDANEGQSFVGSYVLGMGFTFDDTDRKGVASPLAAMERLVESEPRNREAIGPYIGGEELNSSPTHAHHRLVINFRNWPLRRGETGVRWADEGDDRRKRLRRQPVVPPDYPDPVAADWPELLAIVEERVKPERAKLTRNPIGRKRSAFWWQYGSLAKNLYGAVTHLDRVLAVSSVGQHLAFAFLPAGTVFSHALIVFPFDTCAAFCALQSRPHEIWARFLGSSLEDRLRYTPSDCFETFPFPPDWDRAPALEAAGAAYHDCRAALMVRNGEGLTKIYNRFHDPVEDDPEIVRLRGLHAAMDRAVLDACGWKDIPTGCDFFPEHPDEEAPDSSRRRRRFRYRWPDEVREEVLVRLLERNSELAAAEAEARARRGGARLPGPAPRPAESGSPPRLNWPQRVGTTSDGDPS